VGVLGVQWGSGEVFLSLLGLAVFAIWVWLVIAVFVDVFSAHDLSGVARVGWVLLVVVLPYLGVIVYLLARGGRMLPLATRFGLPARSVPAEPWPVLSRAQVDALDRLNAERDAGSIGAEEYRARRERIVQ
jgi:hypothetical protein